MRHLYDNMLWGCFSLAPKAQATVEAIMLAVPQDCAPSSFWPNEDGEFCIGWDAQDGAVFSLEVNDYGAISWTVSEMEQAISFDI